MNFPDHVNFTKALLKEWNVNEKNKIYEKIKSGIDSFSDEKLFRISYLGSPLVNVFKLIRYKSLQCVAFHHDNKSKNNIYVGSIRSKDLDDKFPNHIIC